MTYTDDHFGWRGSFLHALEAMGKAAARLPYGVADPVLCGTAAVELYTGGLWPATTIDVLAEEPGSLQAELMALGFRWIARSSHGERGLWHPTLQQSVAVTTGWRPSTHANALTIVIDTPASQAPALSLRIIAIEDLIAERIKDWLGQGARQGEAATLIQILVGLGWAGAGGRFRPAYLQRRLNHETRGEVALELSSAASEIDDLAPRRIGLTAMADLVGGWRARRGLSNPWPSAGGPADDHMGREGQPPIWTAPILPFRALPPVPG